jgi:hypothetical protein
MHLDANPVRLESGRKFMASLSVAKYVTQLAFGRTKLGRPESLGSLEPFVADSSIKIAPMKHVDLFDDFLKDTVNLNQTQLDELDSCVGADNVERLLSNSLAGSSRCRIGRFLTREASSMIQRS